MEKIKRNITQEDKDCASTLRRLWSDYKNTHPEASIERAASSIGMSQSMFSQLKGGHMTWSTDHVLKISSFFKVEPSTFKDIKNLPKTNKNELMIEQYHDAAGAMGHSLILRDQPGQITSWKVTPEWLNKNVPTNTGAHNLCIVTGFGDSMRGMFNSGDPLLIDTGVRVLNFDAVYFFRVGEEGFIKRLQRIPGEGIRVISRNTEYESWTIRPDMDFEIFGRVLKVWNSEAF